ncbi:hypothetical protein PENANT_c002G02713 [Penicillium antarcticum]|uniref:Uncharacterized protein n=1 Tax=Penicillium antarcticum TaxID=416450 RepID=A0A1V6QL78_9EURO|nr:uncharacterized protein N7508_006724 [Penicillium antarcticum]KAJ5301861.1 hypothetical protein N7508_006724 [Penicillium antarcticum]OQD89955.1 hypothetical protein PENANT_c002G02713 [Penicillium antarcticum]
MDFLPENLQTILQNTTITYLQSTTQAHLSSRLSELRTAILQPYLIEPLSTLLTSYSGAMPDLLSICLLAIIILVSLKILDYAFRMIMFWVVLAFRLVFWGSLIGVGYYVYRVGVEDAARDAGWLFGVVMGFVGDYVEKSQGRAAAYVGGK